VVISQLGKTTTHTVTKFTAGSGFSKGSNVTGASFSSFAASSGTASKFVNTSAVNTATQTNKAAAALSAGSGVSAGSGLSTGGQKTGAGSKAFSTASNVQLQAVFNVLQNAITTVQGNAQTLGANVTLLQTRLSFSADYASTLSGGADKLTLADTNQESTNLVTLQTRQQLSIQSLSIATQSEQAVLRLFH
jgi:flagellin-like hook-associated protein FlgL